MSEAEYGLDLLQCELCMSPYDDPRMLPCLHTFCKTCLITNMSDLLKIQVQGHYHCPLCQKDVPVETITAMTDIDILAERFPQNYLIRDLTRAVELTAADKYCDPCIRAGKKVRAQKLCHNCSEALCIACKKFHGTLRKTMSHVLVNLSEIRHESVKDIIGTPFCLIHEDECLKYYCAKHKETICATCATVNHKHCSSVTTTDKVVQDRLQNTTSVVNRLDNQTKLAKMIYDDRSKTLHQLELNKLGILEKIKEVRKRYEDVFRRWENKIVSEIQSIESKEKQLLQTELSDVQRVWKASRNTYSLMKNATENGSDVHVLMWVDKASKESNNYQHNLLMLQQKMKKPIIDFNIDKTTDTFLTRESFGELKVTHMKSENITNFEGEVLPPVLYSSKTVIIKSNKDEQEPPEKQPKAYVAKAMKTVNVRSADDLNPSLITGIVCLTNSRVAMVDRNNSKVKLYDQELAPLSELELTSQPFDITQVDTTTVAVTIPRERSVQLVNTNVGLTPFKIIMLKDSGYGISYNKDRFAVAISCSTPPAIQLISTCGEELMTICPSESLQTYLFRPWYVTWANGDSSNSLFVSDCTKNAVSCIIGSVVRRFEYRNQALISPRGVTPDNQGGFFVCGWGSDNIQHVNQHGEFTLEVACRKDGLIGPLAICSNISGTKVYVTSDITSNSDNVRIFTLPLNG